MSNGKSLGALMFALALVAGGCGGDNGSAVATTATTVPGSGSATTVPGSGSATTVPPVGSATTTPPSSGGADGWFEVDGRRVNLTRMEGCVPDPQTGDGTLDDVRLVAFGAPEDGEESGVQIEYFGVDRPPGPSGPFPGVDMMYAINFTERQYEGGLSLVDGIWVEFIASPVDSGFALDLGGGRLRGGPITVEQTWPDETGDTHVIRFDLPIPSGLPDCR